MMILEFSQHHLQTVLNVLLGYSYLFDMSLSQVIQGGTHLLRRLLGCLFQANWIPYCFGYTPGIVLANNTKRLQLLSGYELHRFGDWLLCCCQMPENPGEFEPFIWN